MFSKFLFGVQKSPERSVCVVLAVVVTVMGVAIMIKQGREDGASGFLIGLLFTLVGVASVAIVTRYFAVRDEKVATTQQLNKLPGRYNDAALKQIVEHAPHDPHATMNKVTSQIDAAEIQATVDQVRGETGS